MPNDACAHIVEGTQLPIFCPRHNPRHVQVHTALKAARLGQPVERPDAHPVLHEDLSSLLLQHLWRKVPG